LAVRYARRDLDGFRADAAVAVAVVGVVIGKALLLLKLGHRTNRPA
jgi:hypothetical protein